MNEKLSKKWRNEIGKTATVYLIDEDSNRFILT